MKKITLPLLLVFSIAANAQSFEWLNTPETGNTNFMTTGYSVATDPSGNVYYAGFKDNWTPHNDALGDVSVIKYNGNGEMLSVKTISGKCTAYNMVSDSQGNLFLALGYTETMAIGSTAFSSFPGELKKVLVKLDPGGNIIWFKELFIGGFDLPTVEDFRGLAVDNMDNVYAGFDNFNYSYIRKYAPDGEEMLTIEQQNVNRITCVAVDTEGNIYATGGCAGLQSKYGGTDAPTDLHYNTYLVKYTPQGNFAWIKYVEDITCPEPHVVARTPAEIYYSSYLFTENNFDDIEIEGPLDGFEDFFLARLNSDGEYQWVREVNGEGKVNLGFRNYLSIDPAGNVYLAGSTHGNINWGNGVVTSTSGFMNDAFVVKYNSDGIAQFAKTAAGSWDDRFDGIAINSEGGLYVTGIGAGTIKLDNIEHSHPEFDDYPFISKISLNALGNVDNKTINAMVYPSPTDGLVTICGIENIEEIDIYNTLGQRVKSIRNPENNTLDFSTLPQGAYLLIINRLTTIGIVRK